MVRPNDKSLFVAPIPTFLDKMTPKMTGTFYAIS